MFNSIFSLEIFHCFYKFLQVAKTSNISMLHLVMLRDYWINFFKR